VKFVVSSPLLSTFKHPLDKPPHPKWNPQSVAAFFQRHGNGVGAIGIEVPDAANAYKISTQNGATGVCEPTTLQYPDGSKVIIAEIVAYDDGVEKPTGFGDTLLRFIQYDNVTEANRDLYLPGYKAVKDKTNLDYGIARIDHVVGNVHDMDATIANLKKWTGFHTFAKFTKEEIMTRWSSLNSEVLSNNNLKVLLPINEKAPGKKESQIEEYLKAYNGCGVQHIAIRADNVFTTVQKMIAASDHGFEFIPTPATYYEDPIVIARLAKLSPEQQKQAKELGVLVDEDDEGMLLQIFTKPLFDRPTIFIEIIQRRCGEIAVDVPGCGGFGKGNFKALFESIERMQEARGGLLDDTSSPSDTRTTAYT